MNNLPTPAAIMAYAIEEAACGNVELGRLWLDIARELREGSRPATSTPTPRPLRETEALMPARRPVEDKADAAFGKLPEAPRPAGELNADSLASAEAAFGDPATLRRVANRLRDIPDDDPEPVAGDIEPDAERLQRTPRPFIATSASYDAFAAGRDERTRVLSAGDPGHCRWCNGGIYAADSADVGTGHRYRHVASMQAVCATPPKGRTSEGDETYVASSHTFAEPGGVPYRAR